MWRSYCSYKQHFVFPTAKHLLRLCRSAKTLFRNNSITAGYPTAKQTQQCIDVQRCCCTQLNSVSEHLKVTQQTIWLEYTLIARKHFCKPSVVIYLKICPISLWNSWSFLTSHAAPHCGTVRDEEFRSPQLGKHSRSEVWGDLHRQCLVWRFLSEVVPNNLHLDAFKHRLTANEKRQARGVVCVSRFWQDTRGH